MWTEGSAPDKALDGAWSIQQFSQTHWQLKPQLQGWAAPPTTLIRSKKSSCFTRADGPASAAAPLPVDGSASRRRARTFGMNFIYGREGGSQCAGQCSHRQAGHSLSLSGAMSTAASHLPSGRACSPWFSLRTASRLVLQATRYGRNLRAGLAPWTCKQAPPPHCRSHDSRRLCEADNSPHRDQRLRS